MPGKSHMQNTPQGSPGSLSNRRSITGALDARRFAEADIRILEVVSMFGPAYVVVKNPGGTTPYVVANLSGQTHAPGAQVLGASTTGVAGTEAVIGAPPGNKNGSGPMIPVNHSRPSMALPNQYAFGYNIYGSVATVYYEGTYLYTRAVTEGLIGDVTGCILEDSSELVGPGSAVTLGGGSTIEVWDVFNDTIYSYSVPVGWEIVTPAVYQNGELYWVERETLVPNVTTEMDIRLRTSATDLSGASTIQTYSLTLTELDIDVPGATSEVFVSQETYAAASIAVDLDGAVVYSAAYATDANEEVVKEWLVQFRFALSGGAPSKRLWDEPETTGVTGLTIGGTSFRFFLDEDPEPSTTTYRLYSKPDDASSDVTAVWTQITIGSETPLPICANVAPNGTTVQFVGSYPGPIITEMCIARGSAAWSIKATTVQPFSVIDNEGSYPSVMFYFGSD